MTVSMSAVTWDQTVPYIPNRALSRNSMGMLNTSQRMTPRNSAWPPFAEAVEQVYVEEAEKHQRRRQYPGPQEACAQRHS